MSTVLKRFLLGWLINLTIALFCIGAHARFDRSVATVRAPLYITPISFAIPTDPFPVTLVGADGAKVTLSAAPKRIVSLAPSNTEILFDLGAGKSIVANTTADDWPAQAKRLPHIGSVFTMSLESIVAQNPDLIVADRTINAKIILTLQHAGLPVLVVEPTNVATMYDAIRLLGRASGHVAQADDMIHRLQQRFAAIRKAVKGATTRKRVLVMYDVSPIYTSGPNTLIDDIITISGGRNIAKSNAPIGSEEVIQAQPDVIICDPNLEPRIAQLPAWSGAVPAVQNRAYFHTSPGATLIRPCFRLAAGADELARYLHPELFPGRGASLHTGNAPRGKGNE